MRPPGARAVGNDVWEACPWAALVMPRTTELGEISVLVQHVEARSDPEHSVYSTRDYGRFGSFFEADLRPGEPLRWRVLVFLSDLGRHPDDVDPMRLAERAEKFLRESRPIVGGPSPDFREPDSASR